MSAPDQTTQPNNTYVLETESAEEMGRQGHLDHVVTRAMGGPLAHLPLAPDAKILDIACGTGGWVLDAAFERPDSEVAGIDISKVMINYANARARSEGRTNASFGVMDVRQPLDFSDNTFDLVNGRWLTSFLLRQDWPVLLKECLRITKPGGIIRITESDTWGLTNSAGYQNLLDVMYRTMHKGGYGFSPDGKTLGITPKLPGFLRQLGCEQIQVQAHAIDFSAGTNTWADFYHNVLIATQEGNPYPIRMGITTKEELSAWRTQMEIEMHQDDFGGFFYLTSVWGTKPA
ncbi:MAG TPA: methyltransferase domain-containing protein [Ktedonobacteraceae bacterium]|nr:methyltransferase domain-containing protein [Ktedonobacteraceae bacterium]